MTGAAAGDAKDHHQDQQQCDCFLLHFVFLLSAIKNFELKIDFICEPFRVTPEDHADKVPFVLCVTENEAGPCFARVREGFCGNYPFGLTMFGHRP